MKKTVKVLLTVSLLVSLILSSESCGRLQGRRQGSGPFIYYQSIEEDKLIPEEYTFSGNKDKSVKKALDDLQNPESTDDYKSVFTKKVKVERYNIADNYVEVHLNKQYERMNTTQQTLLKAAVVETLTQIEGVVSIEFFVGNAPITDNKGNPAGVYTAESFVQNTGSSIHSTEQAELVLYFADAAGTRLVKEEDTVRYNSNSSIEKVIIEQLIKGPSSGSLQATLPAGTNVLNVTLRDGICYINFSDTFNVNNLKVNPEVTIYSIVNSIVSVSGVNKVQISVNGESNVMYQSVVDLSKPFSENKEIIKEK